MPEGIRRRRNRGHDTLQAMMIARALKKATPRWTGPVIRAPREQLPPLHLTWRCLNPHCREWTHDGAHARGRCNYCQTAR